MMDTNATDPPKSRPDVGSTEAPHGATSIWSKVDFELARREESSETPKFHATEAGERYKARSKRWSRQRPVLDVAATALWSYAFLQTFVFDVDEAVFAQIPGGETLVDFKFLFFLAALGAFVVFLNKRSDALWGLVYVAFFPVVVCCWKIPRLLYRTNSWVVFFSAANVVSTAITHIRRSIFVIGLAMLSGVLVVAADASALVAAGIVGVALLLLGALYRAIRYALSPSSFLDTQEHAIERVMDSKMMERAVAVNDDLKSSDIEKFDETQQTQFVTNLSFGVIAHRLLYFWAYQLDRYRKSTAPVVFNVVAFLGLLVSAVVGWTLINYGISKIDPSAFYTQGTPSLFSFARYSFTSLYGNEISAIHAKSELANAISLVSMFFGIGIIGTFGVTLFNSRRERQNDAAEETIERIKRHGMKLDRLLQKNYEVSVRVAVERVNELRGLFAGVIAFLTDRIPPEFDDEFGRDRPGLELE